MAEAPHSSRNVAAPDALDTDADRRNGADGEAPAHQLLRESDERYRAFLANSTEAIWRFEVDEPIRTDLPVEEQVDLMFRHAYLAECNVAMARMYGFEDPEEIVGARLSDLMPEDEEQNRAYLRAFVEDGYRLTDAASVEVDRHGATHHFLNNLTGIVEGGRLVRAWGTQRDVTEHHKAERDRALLAAIVASSDDAIASKTLDGIVTSWNAGAERIFGYSAAEMIGQPILRVIPPERHHEEAMILGRIRRGEPVEHYETVRRTKDGRDVIISLTVSPIRDSAGNIIGASKVARDVTAQKASEEARRAKEAEARRLGEVLERTANGVVITDSEGLVVWANEAFVRISGYTLEEVLGQRPRDVLRGPASDPGTAAYVQARVQAREPFTTEVLNYRKDGEPYWTRVEASPLFGEDGTFEGYVAIQNDVTEQHAAGEALRESEARKRAMLEVALDAVVTIDENSRIVEFNAAAERTFGYRREDAVGQPMEELLIPEAFRKAHRQGMARYLRTGEHRVLGRRIELTALRADGTEFPVELAISPIPLGGDRQLFTAYLRDISDRKQSEEALRQSEERARVALRAAQLGTFKSVRPERLLYGDARLRKIMGFPPGDEPIPTEEFFGRVHPEDFARTMEVVSSIDRPDSNGRAFVEYRVVWPDGTVRWVEANAEAFYEGEGASRRTVYTVGTVRDVTAEKEAEEALRESEERARLALRAAQLGTFKAVRPERLIYADARLREIFGLPPGDEPIPAEEFFGCIHPDDLGRVRDVSVQIDAPDSDGRLFVEYRVVRPEGEVRWVQAYGHASYEGEGPDRRVVYTVGTVRDMTAQREAEEALRQSEERFRRVSELTSDFAFAARVHPDGTTEREWISGAYERITGYAVGELKGPNTWARIVLPADMPVVLRHGQALLEGRTDVCEVRIAKKDGEVRWLRNYGKPEKDAEGRVVRLYGAAQDITEERRTRRRLEAEHAVSQILAEAETFADAAPALLEALAHTLDAGVAELWMPYQADRLVRAAAHVGQGFPDGVLDAWMNGRLAFERGEGIPGRVWASGQAEWTADLQAEPAFVRAEEAAAAGLHAGVHVPIFAGDEVGGVIALLFTEHFAPDPSLLEALTALGRDVGQFLRRKRAEEVLRASEERFRHLILSLPAAVYTTDREGRITLHNERAAELWGRRPEVGKDLWCGSWKIYRTDGTPLPLDECPMARTLREGRPVRGEEIVIERPDGTRSNVLPYPEPLFDADGEIVGAVNMLVDITERKAAETALRESEARFRTLADSAPVLIWVAGADRRYTYFNAQWLAFTGRTLEQELGDGWTEGVHPDDRARVVTAFASAFDARKPLEMEYRLRHHGGEYRWVLDRGTPRFTEDGAFLGYIGSGIDIHDRKAAEARARFLAGAGAILDASLDSRATLRNVAQLAVPGFADWCTVDILTEDGTLERLAIAHAEPEKVRWIEELQERYPPEPSEDRGALKVARTGQSDLYPVIPEELLRQVAKDEEHLALLRGLGMRSAIIAPLQAGGEVQGVISFVTAESGRHYATEDLETAEEIGRRGGAALASAQLHEALREQEEQLALALDAGQLATWSWHVPSGVVSWSEGVYEMLGYTPGEVEPAYEAWRAAVHPDDRPAVDQALRWAMEGTQPRYLIEHRVALNNGDDNGDVRWLEARGEFSFDEEGRPLHLVGVVADITERKRAEALLAMRAQQQATVAEIGRRALRADDPQELFDHAVEAIAGTLGVEYCKVLELLPGGDYVFLRAGVGWQDGLVGQAKVDTGLNSQAGYTLISEAPIVVEDLRTETRFSGPPLLRDHGVISGMSCVIPGPEGRPWGVLGTHSTAKRAFTADDVHFLQAVANLLGSAVQRKEAEGAIRDQAHTLATLNRINIELAGELDLHQLVQAATDAATELTGAQFGAFFYNVLDERGEAYTLYTISGAPREAFEQFPMPRNTEVFEPTFHGTGVVRADDITQDPRYGKNAPYHGMPKGHLPVRSYLAVPVASRSGEVLGGLFFGHAEVGIFTERAEQLAVGIAAQAAVAMDNARLFEQAQREIEERQQMAEVLRESEARFRTLADSAPVLIWVADEENRGTYFNRQWLEFTGRTLEQELGFGWAESVHADDLQRSVEHCQRSFDARQEFRMEFRLRRADGVYRWVLDHGTPRFTPDGTFLGYIGSCIDIDDRKRVETRMRFLAEAGSLLEQGLDYEATLQQVAGLAVPEFAEWCGVSLVTEEGAIESVAVAHADPDKVAWAREIGRRYPVSPDDPTGAPQVIRTGQAELYAEIPDELLERAAKDEEHLALLRGLGMRSAIIAPLQAGPRIVGAISFVQGKEGRGFEEADVVVAEELGRRAGAVLETARLHAAVRESEARLRGIFEGASVSIWEEDFSGAVELLETLRAEGVTDLRAYFAAHPDRLAQAVEAVRVNDVNEFTVQLYGAKDKAELVGSLSRIFLPETTAVFVEELATLYEGGRYYRGETVVRTLDGRPFPILFSVSFEGERAERTVVSILDITELKEAGEALRQSEARFRRLAEALPQIAYTLRADGSTEYLNPRWYEYTGLPEGTSYAEAMPGVVHPDDLAHVRAEWARTTETGEPLEIELRMRRHDGVYRWFLTRAVPLRDEEGSILRWFGTSTDIHPLKEARAELEARVAERTAEIQQAREDMERANDELERSNRELDQFAYVASHDLKAPLRAIENLAVWVEEDAAADLPADSRRHLHTLRGRVTRMERLLDDLLAFSRAGRDMGGAEQIDTAQLIREVVDLVAPPGGFSVEVVGPLPTVISPRAPLEMVFRNLIGNAIKHHDRPEGRVVVRAGADAPPGYAAFEVADDGPGIAPAYHERIFGIFQTLRPRDEVEGSGVGLAVVKKAVEARGGNILVESEEGRGATFRFTWPLQPDR